MSTRPEPRLHVDFPVSIAVQDRAGAVRQITGRCTDLSASGARIETRDALEVRSTVMVSSREFGRMGHANVRYCRRESMKYTVGLQFNVQFGLSDPARRRMLAKVSTADSTGPSRMLDRNRLSPKR